MIADPDVQAFQRVWVDATRYEITTKPEPVVVKALDRLAIALRKRLLTGSSLGASLKPFQDAVTVPHAATTEPSSLGAWSFRDGDRLLLNVRIGRTSAVRAFDSVGHSLVVPGRLAWSYDYAGPFQMTGPLFVFEAISIQDAGMRYGFRLTWLRRNAQGYADAGRTSGTWTLGSRDEDYLTKRGNRVEIQSLDAPKAFFVASPVRLLRQTEIWDVSKATAVRVAVKKRDRDLRAVDDWLWKHRGGRLNAGRAVPSEPSMADDITRGRSWIQLRFDDLTIRFELSKRGSDYLVRRATAQP